MAETSWPYPDPANSNKRIVTDVQFEALYHPVSVDGLLGTPADTTLIYGDDSGRQVKVRADRLAVLRGHGWASDTSGKTITIAANSSGSTRVDLVVLRLTRSTWQVTTEVRQGTPGSAAPSPVTDLGTTGVYEIALAEVSVPTGDTLIGAAQVTSVAWYVGSDGQYLCTSTTRPPHEAGRVIWETTGRRLISNGTAWIVDYEDTGLVSLTPATGWSTSPGAGYLRVQRRSGFVSLDWNLRRSGSSLVANANVLIHTSLASAYRPTGDKFPPGWATRGLSRVQVAASDGEVWLLDHPGVTSGEFITGTVTYPVA